MRGVDRGKMIFLNKLGFAYTAKTEGYTNIGLDMNGLGDIAR